MTEQSPPTTAAAAADRLSVLHTDAAFCDKLLGGDITAKQQYHDLIKLVADGGDRVDRAMAGTHLNGDVFDSDDRMTINFVAMLREIGVRDGIIRENLEGHVFPPEELRAVQDWKTRSMRNPEFVKRYLSGSDPEAREKMTIANLVLSSAQPNF